MVLGFVIGALDGRDLTYFSDCSVDVTSHVYAEYRQRSAITPVGDLEGIFPLLDLSPDALCAWKQVRSAFVAVVIDGSTENIPLAQYSLTVFTLLIAETFGFSVFESQGLLELSNRSEDVRIIIDTIAPCGVLMCAQYPILRTWAAASNLGK